MAELRDEIEAALAAEDDDNAARVQAELDAVIQELARSFGLGGQPRRLSSAAERARVNVTRAIRSAIVRITEAVPDLGASLDRSIRTGAFCVYAPHHDDRVTWTVHSTLNDTP